MMSKFGEDQEMAQKFARIWDACAEFDKPVASQFKMKKAEEADNFQEREHFLDGTFQITNFIIFMMILDFIKMKAAKLSRYIMRQKVNEKISRIGKDCGDYTQVIDFPTFLLHVLSIWEGKDTSEVQLDDKKLLNSI